MLFATYWITEISTLTSVAKFCKHILLEVISHHHLNLRGKSEHAWVHCVQVLYSLHRVE